MSATRIERSYDLEWAAEREAQKKGLKQNIRIDWDFSSRERQQLSRDHQANRLDAEDAFERLCDSAIN